MEDLPLDFSRYLSERLGLTSEQADDLLAAWLKDYKPVSCRPTGMSRRSGNGAASREREVIEHTG